MKTVDEQFEILEELVRKVNTYLYPFKEDEDIAYFQKRDLRNRLYGKYPKCFLTLRGRERDIPFLPICNRMGIQDPKMINFSINLAKKLQQQPKINQDELTIILAKLKRLQSTYLKDIPKPPLEASRKAMITRMLGNMKRYLDNVRKN